MRVPLWIWASRGELSGQNNSCIRQRLIKIRPVYYLNTLRHLTFEKVPDLPTGQYLFLLTGIERMSQITLPILESLAPASRLIITTHYDYKKCLNDVPYFYIKKLRVSFEEWHEETSKLFPKLTKHLEEASKRFGLGENILYRIQALFLSGVENILRAEIALEHISPSILITEHDRRSVDAIFCQVAGHRGIPSVTLEHGLQGNEAAGDIQWIPLIADYAIVWGEISKRYYVERSVPADRIHIGGYPRLNPISDDDHRGASQFLQRHSIDIEQPIVVFLSSSLWERKIAVRLFLESVQELSNIHWMIRPHPQENLEWYAQNIPNVSEHIQDPSEWTLTQSLASAEIVVGSGSSACLDALILVRPLILIPDSGPDYRSIPILGEAVRAGAAKVATKHHGLQILINEAINNKSSIEQNDQIKIFSRKCAACIGEEAAISSAAQIIELAKSSLKQQ